MKLDTDDTLRISVNTSAVGNQQKWVRTIAEMDDCSSYQPSLFSDVKSEKWMEPNETDSYPGLLLPVGDAGGGIYTVSIENDENILPALKITSNKDNSGAISSGTAAGTNDQTVRKTSFLVHPGISYNVEAQYSSFVIATNPIVNYRVIYSFSGRMDCYEPNDIFTEAKRIPKNSKISAYALTGYINNSVVGNEAQNNDYYRVQLESKGRLKVELLQVPTSVNLKITILRADESALISTFEEISGKVTDNGAIYNTTTNSELSPGNYIIRIYIGGERKTVINHDESVPDHWNTPYEFKVTRID